MRRKEMEYIIERREKIDQGVHFLLFLLNLAPLVTRVVISRV